MKYFIDTEFIEGSQTKRLLSIPIGKTKPTIDLISIGIVAEDGREYYAISKDFNLKEAWNRYDLVRNGFRDCGMTPNYKKVYWIRDNVCKHLFSHIGYSEINTFKEFKKLINHFGKTQEQIAAEIINFCKADDTPIYTHTLGYTKVNIGAPDEYIAPKVYVESTRTKPEFYGYYADYDWVVFCWLFGRMVDLPKGFPMVAFDIQQQIEEYNVDKEQLLKEVPQENIHNSLEDARWNYKAYNRIQHKINNNV